MKRFFSPNSIKTRLKLWFFGIGLLPLLVFSAVIYPQRVNSIKQEAFIKLAAIRDLKITQINHWLDERSSDIKALAEDEDVAINADHIVHKKGTQADDTQNVKNIFDRYIKNYAAWDEIFLIEATSGKIIVSSNHQSMGLDKSDMSYFKESLLKRGLHISNIFYSKSRHQPAMVFSHPIFCPEDKNLIIGILVARVDLQNSLYTLLLDRSGMGSTGETLIVNNKSVALNELRWSQNAPLRLQIVAKPAVLSSQGSTGIVEAEDYRNEKVLAAYGYIPRVQWGFVAKQDQIEIYAPITRLLQNILIILVISLITIYFVSDFIANTIAQPVLEMTRVSKKVTQGDLTARNQITSNDEIGFLSESFNQMADSVMSQILIQQRVVALTETLVVTKDISDFSQKLVTTLMEMTNAGLAAFYRKNETRNQFEHIYSIGGSSSTLDPFDISMLEGEFGKAAAFGKTVRIQNIPRDTVFKLRSIAGTAIPTEIITIPVKAYNQVKAIISLASLTPFSKDDLLIIDLVLSSINTAFANIIAIEETRLLARELEVKNQELESQTTEMRRQSYELVDQNTELERQQKEVEEANRLKSEFLSNMSHELRTPLNSIMALSRILARRTKDIISEEESEFLEIIERNGKQLLALINDILDLSKIEAGKVELECQKFSIPSIIDTILSSVGHLAAEKNIAINQQFEVGLPDIESDQSRVHQILQNIIGNAIKFTMRGSVSILVNRQPGNIIIQVKDTGIGISRETLPHIFDEFRQGDGSASRRYEGTGLGLAIAYKAANLLGGNIKVESALGQGTTFTVLLPFKREQMSLDVSKTASIASTPSFQLDLDSTQKTGFALGATGYITKPITKQALMSEIKKVVSPGPRSILLVEDNESAIIQVTHTLRAAGYQVDVARGGQEAIDFVQNTIPDGIVLDLMMPEVNGFEVLDKIRGTEATAEIPVLILTAKDLSKKDLKKLSANNVQQLVQKGDVDPDNLLFEIQLMLGTKPRPLSITSRIEKPTVTHPVRTETPVKKKEGKPSILIVEDNPDNMFTIKAILGDSYHLLEAIDGEAGLEATQTALPDLVLLDMSLPKMDGFQVVREIKANDQTRSIPVIAITARAMKGEKEKILEAGCDNYISKPIDPDLLVDEIKKWLK